MNTWQGMKQREREQGPGGSRRGQSRQDEDLCSAGLPGAMHCAAGSCWGSAQRMGRPWR
eukprot:SAG22_NODE_13028_length_421_cov_0.788820_1_plen_58_part_10